MSRKSRKECLAGPFDLLEKIVGVFERLAVPYLITGSVASTVYGEPRMTNDIDVVAALESGHVKPLIALFPPDDYYLSEDAIKEAIRRHSQFNIIHPASGLKVDVIIKTSSDFDKSRFGRARKTEVGEGLTASFAAPEDVIIKKMEYYSMGGSEKHLRDILGILKISGELIDVKYLESWADRLGLGGILKSLKEKP